jgi:hypothetical protein
VVIRALWHVAESAGIPGINVFFLFREQPLAHLIFKYDMELSPKAKQARREYKRKWREKNREHVRRYNREWKRKHPERVKEHARRYWEKKAAERQKAKR